MIEPCDFSYLGHNLALIRELSSTDASFTLIPDPDETKVVKSTSFLGRIWSFSYNFTENLSLPCMDVPTGLEKRKLLKTLGSIKAECKKAFQEIQSIDQKYRSCLMREGGQDSLEAQELHSLISETRKSLEVLIPKRCVEAETFIEPLQLQFLKLTGKPLIEPPEVLLLNHFAKDYAMITLRGHLKRNFPISSFLARLGENAKLDTLQIKELNEWVLVLEEKKLWMRIGILHMALWGLFETLFQDTSKLADLELLLFRAGCHYLNEDDPDHLAWVETLQPEVSQLRVNDEWITLGKRREIPCFTENKVIVFEIKDKPSELVVIGRNQVQLALWQIDSCQQHFAKMNIKCKMLDPMGRFCTIDTISCTLDEIQWQSRDRDVSENDAPYLKPIVEFLQELGRKTAVPKVLEPKNFLVYKISKENIRMRVFPMLEREQFAPGEVFKKNRLLHKLEAFALACSKNNRVIFRELMRRSNLIDHPLASVYQRVVQRHLLSDWKTLPVPTEIHLENIADPEIVDRATALVAGLKQVQSQIMATLQPLLKDQAEASLQALHQGIAELLIDFQKDMGMCSVTHSSLLEIDTLKGLAKEIANKHPQLFALTFI